MSMSVHVNLMMFRYVIKSRSHKIEVIQFKDPSTKKWGEVTVSSMVHFGCGKRAGLDPFEMLNEIMALVEELRLVLIVLDNAQKQMGDDYHPPLLPFKDEFLPECPTHDQIRSAIIDLHDALWDRDRCADCGGQGWTYTGAGGEVEKEICDCAGGAEEMLAKHTKTVRLGGRKYTIPTVLPFKGEEDAPQSDYCFYDVLGFRQPKAGEYFLSGALVTVYRAPNDLGEDYLVVKKTLSAKREAVWVAEDVNDVQE